MALQAPSGLSAASDSNVGCAVRTLRGYAATRHRKAVSQRSRVGWANGSIVCPPSGRRIRWARWSRAHPTRLPLRLRKARRRSCSCSCSFGALAKRLRRGLWVCGQPGKPPRAAVGKGGKTCGRRLFAVHRFSRPCPRWPGFPVVHISTGQSKWRLLSFAAPPRAPPAAAHTYIHIRGRPGSLASRGSVLQKVRI